MNKALLDTDILSEIIKGIDRAVAKKANAYRLEFERYTLSTITIVEVVKGFQKKAPDRVDELVKRSQLRQADPFDLPPPTGSAAPALPAGTDPEPVSKETGPSTPQ